PAALDLDQLFVAERDLFDAERVVGAAEQEPAVDALLGLDLLLVDDQPSAAAGQVAAQAGVGEQQRLGGATVVGGALALKRGPLGGDAGERALAASGVAGGLMRVAADDEAAPRFALTDPDLLHLEVVAHLPVAARTGERLQVGAPGAQLLAHDEVAAG